ncbi:MAG TPA: hypothetical protein VMF58_12760 [Rhizomicrobium sp.]|nr:hypothetical protein [Rhizomicrobium sp.]
MTIKSAALAIVLLSASVASAAETSLDPKAGTVFSPERAKDLIGQCSRDVPRNVTGTWQPTSDQITDLELRLLAALKAAWPAHAQSNSMSSPTYDHHFVRQYGGLVLNGRKIIYVNAFPSSVVDFDGSNVSPAVNVDWRSVAIRVCDGGNRFWGAEYDPATKKFDHFAFNGAV